MAARVGGWKVQRHRLAFQSGQPIGEAGELLYGTRVPKLRHAPAPVPGQPCPLDAES